MPQILLVIIALIIKLAVEGSKEMKKYSGDDLSNSERFENRTGNNSNNYKYNKHQSLSEMISNQNAKSYRTNPAPMYTPTSQSNNDEELKHEKKYDSYATQKQSSYNEDQYEMKVEDIDTQDYEEFNNIKEEDVNSTEDFVDSSLNKLTTYDQRSNKIKLMIYMLVYCMWEDDNEFTKKERRMFKMISRVVSVNLNKKDSEEVNNFIDERPNLDSIVRKQQQYQLDITDVIETTSNLRQHLKSKDQYSPILERIEKRFQYEL